MQPDDQDLAITDSAHVANGTAVHKPAKRPAKKIRHNAPAKDGGKIAAVWVPVGKLTPWVKNPHKRDRAKDRKLARTIRAEMKTAGRDGFGAPLLARKANGELIGGHRRLRAAMLLKMTHVPVRYLDVSAKQAHRMSLADNRHAKDVDDDEEMLEDAIAEMDEDDLELAGFEEKEIEDLLRDGDDLDGDGDEEEDEPEIDEEPEAKFQVVITCKSEDDQVALLERFAEEGLDVRALVG